jgi:hypothetical protein
VNDCTAQDLPALELLAAQATLKWPFDQFRRTVVKPATGGIEIEATRLMLNALLNGIRRGLTGIKRLITIGRALENCRRWSCNGISW